MSSTDPKLQFGKQGIRTTTREQGIRATNKDNSIDPQNLLGVEGIRATSK